jgi:hypothetical protein
MTKRGEREVNWINPHGGAKLPLRKKPMYSLKSIKSAFGTPCSCCFGVHDCGVVNLLSNCHYDKDGHIRVYCCHVCQSLLCDSCGQGFRSQAEFGIQTIAQCAWCAQIMQFKLLLLSSKEREDFLEPYRQAEEGILYLRQWQGQMWNKHQRKFHPDEMYWGECVVERCGWRFFIDFKRLVTIAHPAQYNLFVSKMMQNSRSSLLNSFKFTQLQRKMLTLTSEFYMLEENDQFVYFTPRKLSTVHSFSVTMLRELPSKIFTMVMNRLCANMAEKMARGLGIVG